MFLNTAGKQNYPVNTIIEIDPGWMVNIIKVSDLFTRIFSKLFYLNSKLWSQQLFMLKKHSKLDKLIDSFCKFPSFFAKATWLFSVLRSLRKQWNVYIVEEKTFKIQLKRNTSLLSASKVMANSNINSITRIVMLLTQWKKEQQRPRV